ncbi:hypothetical protein OC834_003326 [Tilletia horrida]|nr:hypothetical protein OC834_003326 [Tilletia horrida]
MTDKNVSTATAARRTRVASSDSADEAELQALQHQVRTSTAARQDLAIPMGPTVTAVRAPSSQVAERGQEAAPASVGREHGWQPAKTSTAGPILSHGETDPAILAKRRELAERMLESQRAEESSSSVVPRLGSQFGAGHGTSMAASAGLDKGKAKEQVQVPERPSTPPPKSQDVTADLTAKFARLTPRSKQHLLGMLLQNEGQEEAESDDDDQNDQGFGTLPAVTSNPYRSVLKHATTSPGVATKRARGASSEPALKIKRARERTAQEHDHQRPPHFESHSDGEDDWELQPHEMPFQPGAQAVDFSRPHASIMTRLVNGQFVALWHFTEEGIMHGYERGARVAELSGSFSSIIDSVAKSAEPPAAAKSDLDLSFAEASAAMDMLSLCMWDAASMAPDQLRRKILEIRNDYYNTPYNKRFDPTDLQKDRLGPKISAWLARVRAESALKQWKEDLVTVLRSELEETMRQEYRSHAKQSTSGSSSRRPYGASHGGPSKPFPRSSECASQR